jgi:thymidylate synthase (FAD)
MTVEIGPTGPLTKPNHRGSYIHVLDHGMIRLVDYMGDDLSVIRAARVSFNAAWRTGENEGNDDKLLRRLWTGGDGKPALLAPAHSTPFEAVCATFEVKAPIFVFRQWHRHRTQSYNELSLRYKEHPGDQYYTPEAAVVGVQSTSNKQGRSHSLSGEEAAQKDRELTAYAMTADSQFAAYHNLLELKWPRELARGILPVATYSHMFTTANLLNFLRFLTLRADSHAQYEIRVYAHAMAELLDKVVPKTMALWREGVKTQELMLDLYKAHNLFPKE